mgnify:CR=1 FL=1
MNRQTRRGTALSRTCSALPLMLSAQLTSSCCSPLPRSSKAPQQAAVSPSDRLALNQDSTQCCCCISWPALCWLAAPVALLLPASAGAGMLSAPSTKCSKSCNDKQQKQGHVSRLRKGAEKHGLAASKLSCCSVLQDGKIGGLQPLLSSVTLALAYVSPCCPMCPSAQSTDTL